MTTNPRSLKQGFPELFASMDERVRRLERHDHGDVAVVSDTTATVVEEATPVCCDGLLTKFSSRGAADDPFNLTTTYEDVPYLSILLTIPSDAITRKAVIHGMLTFDPDNGVTQLLQGQLLIDAVAHSCGVEHSTSGDGGRSSVSATWETDVLFPGVHSFVMQARAHPSFTSGGNVRSRSLYVSAYRWDG